MPLDADARRNWPPEPPEAGPPREPPPDPRDALMRKVFGDPLFRACAIELITSAFEEAGIFRSPVTPKMYERVIASDPAVCARLQAVFSAVQAEQQRGWRA